MAKMVELGLEEGGTVLVEVDSPGGGPVTRGRPSAEVVVQAGETLESVLGRLGPALRGIVTELRRSADSPADIEVEFAIKLSADAGVIIARTGAEANFRIALRWAGGRR